MSSPASPPPYGWVPSAPTWWPSRPANTLSNTPNQLIRLIGLVWLICVVKPAGRADLTDQLPIDRRPPPSVTAYDSLLTGTRNT